MSDLDINTEQCEHCGQYSAQNGYCSHCGHDEEETRHTHKPACKCESCLAYDQSSML